MLSTPLIVLGTLAILLCIAGIIEFQNHLTSLNAIPLRIHVNGTRGKSSVTRLIAAGLREGGLRTFAKTTGTAPRVIDADGKDRIIHRLRLPSIGEQVRLLKYFASEKPDAVVMECMAVQPQYQWIAEHQMVKSQVGVITNVRPDHLEEMGPTEEDVALSLCNTIPVDGVLITGEDQKTDLSHVATSHLIRLIIIVTVFPFFVNSYYDANLGDFVQETLKDQNIYDFLILIITSVILVFIFDRFKVPAALLSGTLVASGLLQFTEIASYQISPKAVDYCLLVLGASVG